MEGNNTVLSVCVTNEKYMALQRQSWSIFVIILQLSKTEVPDRTGNIAYKSLVSYDFQNLQLIILAGSLQKYIESIYNLLSRENNLVNKKCLYKDKHRLEVGS